jgi:hypothetical protein
MSLTIIQGAPYYPAAVRVGGRNDSDGYPGLVLLDTRRSPGGVALLTPQNALRVAQRLTRFAEAETARKKKTRKPK